MPTQEKIDRVAALKEKLERCTIAVTTDYTGITVNEMTELRRQMRAAGVEFTIVKNTLMYRASDAAQRPQFKEIVQGPTGIAFGYGDPVEPARALAEYIRVARSPLKIRGGLIDGRVLSSGDVEALAALPSKEVLAARLLGQLQAPISGLLNVLNGPISGLARVLQAHIDKSATPQSNET